jgi:hypothetical protein
MGVSPQAAEEWKGCGVLEIHTDLSWGTTLVEEEELRKGLSRMKSAGPGLVL